MRTKRQPLYVGDPISGSGGVAGVAPAGTYEPALGNPAADAYLLKSTAAGVRSWQDPAAFAPASQCPSISLVTTSAPKEHCAFSCAPPMCPSISLVTTSAPPERRPRPRRGQVSVDQLSYDVGAEEFSGGNLGVKACPSISLVTTSAPQTRRLDRVLL